MKKENVLKVIKSFEGKIVPKRCFNRILNRSNLKVVGSTVIDSPNLSQHFCYVSDKNEEETIFVGLKLDDNYEKVIGIDTSVIL